MPFGFSMGEVVVTLGVVAVAFGPKDIPVIARGLGRMAGQAVGACASRAPRFGPCTQCSRPVCHQADSCGGSSAQLAPLASMSARTVGCPAYSRASAPRPV